MNTPEQKLDAEFKKMDAIPYIHHFFAVSPFSAITIASFHSSWEEVSSFLHTASWSISLHNRASSLMLNLATEYYIYGVFIFDKGVQFNRQRGRIKAKGRLLKHLKEIGK